MKNLFAFILALLFSLSAIAQQTYTLKRDTINLRGYVYNSDGRPAGNVVISSKALDLVNNKDILEAVTDSSGRFEIKGAKFNDTLDIRTMTASFPPRYYNHGSRYVVIYLPAPTIIDLNKKDSVIITAQRKHPKVTPSFKIIKSEDVKLIDVIERYPEFIGGNDRFLAYLKEHLIYPENAVAHNIEGEVKIRFTVEKDGTLINLKILQGIGYGCDGEALRVLKTGPRWKPAIFGFLPVAMDHTIAIQFRLTK